MGVGWHDLAADDDVALAAIVEVGDRLLAGDRPCRSGVVTFTEAAHLLGLENDIGIGLAAFAALQDQAVMAASLGLGNQLVDPGHIALFDNQRVFHLQMDRPQVRSLA